MTHDIELVRELSLLFGPTGGERAVADYIENILPELCDSFCRDRMGNIIALVRTGDKSCEHRRRVMLSAHMDEVGIMISEICDDGLCRFDTVGGINVSVLEGRKVVLDGKCGYVTGVVASKAIHHKKRSERNKPTPMDKLYIDIGARDKDDAQMHVSVGTLGTFRSEFYTFGKDDSLIKGKALDDRMGCAALLEVMAALRSVPADGALDLYFCFTVREEIGLSGARVVAQRIRPELAIVLESTAIADLPNVDESKRVASIGNGGAISLMDRSTIYSREFTNFALSVARDKGIPVQIKRYVSGGNDAGSIHKTGTGVRTLALSAPTRYLHSPACVAALSDYRAVSELTEAMIRDGLNID